MHPDEALGCNFHPEVPKGSQTESCRMDGRVSIYDRPGPTGYDSALRGAEFAVGGSGGGSQGGVYDFIDGADDELSA